MSRRDAAQGAWRRPSSHADERIDRARDLRTRGSSTGRGSPSDRPVKALEGKVTAEDHAIDDEANTLRKD